MVVLGDSRSVGVHDSQVVLGGHMSLFCSITKPRDGFVVVLGDPVAAVEIRFPQVELGLGVASLCSEPDVIP